MNRLAACLAGLLLLACGPGGSEASDRREQTILSFFEESHRLRLDAPASELVVKILAPEGWRSGQEGDQRPCYSVQANGSVHFDLTDVPSDAELVMDAAIRKGHFREEGRAVLELTGDTGGSSSLELDSSEALPVEERHWHELRLPVDGAKRATLKLSYEGTRELPPNVLLSKLGLRVALSGTLSEATPKQPNLIVIVIDTLRADALGTYGYESGQTPVLDGLARQGMLFERAYSAAPWTVPSTVSLLTGLTPAEHGVDFDSTNDPLGSETFVADSFDTLAEVLGREGLSTGAFCSNPLISERSNSQQGFDHFIRYGWAQAGEGPIDDALAWLDEQDGKRSFLYLHLVDPHAPYEPDEAFRAHYSSEEPASFEAVRDGSLQKKAWAGDIDQEAFDAANRHARLLYDGEVASVDAQIGRFLEQLAMRGLLETSILAVTSDHGEEFGEYGAIGHVNNLYDPTLRVPLLVKGPQIPAGVRVPFPVENRRLGSTLLSLAGIDPPSPTSPWAEPALFELERPDGPIFFCTRHGRTRMGAQSRWIGYEQFFGVLVADRLLHWMPENERRKEFLALYDLKRDPDARRDLARRRPEEAETLRRLIEDWIERGDRARRARGARSVRSEPDLEALRGLGYLDEEE